MPFDVQVLKGEPIIIGKFHVHIVIYSTLEEALAYARNG